MSDSALTREAVEAAIGDFPDPESGRSVTQMGQIAGIEVSAERIQVNLGLTTHSAFLWEETCQRLQQQLQEALPKAHRVEVVRTTHARPPEKIGEIGLTAKSVLAVGSGKGGVGKSTVAAALAYSLSQAGSAVGLMDADVYGPSIPHLVGVQQRPEVVERKIMPIEKDGLRIMSMGLLVPPDEAVVWRGPMLHGAIAQFLRDTLWGELDYLIIDLPPGTGDVALTLSQLLPLTGAVVVCTPQDVALLDATKAIAMFRKVNIPLLGIVENMSGFVCPDCGKRYDIFGSGGARRRAEQLQVPFLGEVPINIQIRERGDEGDFRRLMQDAVAGPVLKDLGYRLVRQISQRSEQEPPLPTLSVL